MATTLAAEDKKQILAALRKISDSWTRVEAERDLVKVTKKDICKELELDRKTFTKAAKIFHKQNLGEQEAQLADVKDLLKALALK